MKTTEYRTAIKKLGLSIVGAAPVLGISRRQAQRFHAGGDTGADIPAPVAKLLRLMIKFEVKPEDVK